MKIKETKICLFVLAALALAGCATTPTPQLVDTFCASPASKKRVWNPETDSVASMREATVFNTYVDRRCGVPGRVASKS
jgi:hypothetical protein